MIIGITGGVGSGKSTILDILEQEYGAHIIKTDDVARQLQAPGGVCYDAIVREFGANILEDEAYGKPINRAALAKIVFADGEKLKKLDAIVHPKVKEKVIDLISWYRLSDSDTLIIIESAILIEEGYSDIVDEIWAVTASFDVRVKRLMESRGYTTEKTLSIMANQKSNEEFAELTDYMIDNSGSLDESRKQIAARLGSPCRSCRQ